MLRVTKAIITTLVFSCVAGLASCSEQTKPASTAPEFFEQKSGLYDVTSLDVYADGDKLHLLLAGKTSKETGQTGVRYLRSSDAGNTRSDPVALPDRGARAPFNLQRGNDAQIATHGDKLTAVWPVAGDGWGGAGPFFTAISDDGGKSWHTGTPPGADAAPSSQGFLDLAYDANAILHAVWLDSRDGAQGLHAAQSADNGASWSATETLDEQTCECCGNALRVSSKDTRHVLYRNIEPRDMALANKQADGDWQKRGPAGRFDWQFDGCPHTGGGLAVIKEKLHAAVWTGKAEKVGVHYIHSADDGQTWSTPQRLGDENSRHPDLAAGSDNLLLAAWDRRDGQGYAIEAARSRNNGKSWQALQTVWHSAALLGSPKVVKSATGFLIFWSEEGAHGGRGWRVVRVAF